MKFFKLKKQNNQRGSATVEAIVSFSGFLFVIFTIINVVNFCRAQMLISNAVDTATKEITQYSYFYKMSGLQKFSKDFNDNAQDGKANLNDIIGTVDSLYSSIGTAADNTVEHATNIQNAVEEGNLNMTNIQNTLSGLKTDGTNIKTSMNSVMSAFDSVQDNPLLYMKSIVAVAGNESLDLLKSHVIAAPLARSFTAKHFGNNTSEADEFLEGLGVVDGLDGMNFNMSTIFSSKSPEDVHIVVYYKLRIVQLFGWEVLEVPMCKESVARAWLGGDNVQSVVEPMVPASIDEESSDSDLDSEEPSDSEIENTVESTGFWAYDDPLYDLSDRQMAFGDYLDEQYGVEHLAGALHYDGNADERTMGYACHAYTEWTYEPRDSLNGKVIYPGADLIETLARGQLNFIGECEITQYDQVTPVEFNGLTYVIYVPENMPEDHLARLNADVAVAEKNIAEYISNNNKGIPTDLICNIIVEPTQGTYDYSSAGETTND